MQLPWSGAGHRLNLFWRTFLSLALLIAASLLTWLQTFRAFEIEPHSLQSAREVASLVNLTRAALRHADAIARVSLVKTLADEEGLRIAPREPGDRFSPYDRGPQAMEVAQALKRHLGPDTVVAREVNGEPGLWIAFSMDSDSYWLLLDPLRVSPIRGSTWLLWMGVAVALSLSGAALIARVLNRPLRDLMRATAAVRSGRFAAARLDENLPTTEVSEVNRGFNQMVAQMEDAERDRNLMLAGISHDLRTPLARLRLEAELSVPDISAKDHMVADMAQIEGILNKFIDYARQPTNPAHPLELGEFLSVWVKSQVGRDRLMVTFEAPIQPVVALADDVDLRRVLDNLLENALRYGQTPGTSETAVRVSLQTAPQRVRIVFSDAGPGVKACDLHRLTQPFFRGDAARSQANGAGLGLAIVDKLLRRMGAELRWDAPGVEQPTTDHPAGPGLTAVLELQRAVSPLQRSD
jgi:two-component system osmolarity sensor histidine kinase EnvZ